METLARRTMPQTLAPHFDAVNRYWDNANQVFAAKITPGEFYVSAAGEMVTTVLGSCISACVRDRVSGVGGMNHFMLPHVTTYRGDQSRRLLSAAGRYGNVAMERLINSILSSGGRRDNLEFKVFGGASVLDIDSEVGQRNILFISEYLRLEDFAIAAQDLGGELPRKVNYFPRTGRVLMKKLRRLNGSTLQRREKAYFQQLDQETVESEVTLFNV